MELWLIFS